MQNNILIKLFEWQEIQSKQNLTAFLKDILLYSNVNNNEELTDCYTRLLKLSISNYQNQNDQEFLLEFFHVIQSICTDFMNLDNKFEYIYKTLEEKKSIYINQYRSDIEKKSGDIRSYLESIATSIANKLYLFSVCALSLLPNSEDFNPHQLTILLHAINPSFSETIIDETENHLDKILPDIFFDISLSDSESDTNENIDDQVYQHNETEDDSYYQAAKNTSIKPEFKEKKKGFFQTVKEKWKSTPLHWKIGAGIGISLGLLIIIGSAILLPPSLLVTIPLLGGIPVYALTITAGGALTASAITGHAVHIAMQEEVNDDLKIKKRSKKNSIKIPKVSADEKKNQHTKKPKKRKFSQLKSYTCAFFQRRRRRKRKLNQLSSKTSFT